MVFDSEPDRYAFTEGVHFRRMLSTTLTFEYMTLKRSQCPVDLVISN